RMASHFETLLRSIVADPDRSIAALPLLTAEERRAMIEASQGERVDAVTSSVCELFEQQAARTPDAVAVTCGEQSVTYAELAARVTRAARALVRTTGQAEACPTQGTLHEPAVGQASACHPGIVAVLMPRGIDFITALLAVNRAGGAFLPLDTRHPASRTAQ